MIPQTPPDAPPCASPDVSPCVKTALYVAPDGRSTEVPLPEGVQPAPYVSRYGKVYVLTAVLRGDAPPDAAILEAVRAAEAAGELEVEEADHD